MVTKSDATSDLQKRTDGSIDIQARQSKLNKECQGIQPFFEFIRHHVPSTNEPDLFTILFYLNPHWTVLSTVEDGVIVAANDAFYEITGYSEAEVIGRPSSSLGLLPQSEMRNSLVLLLSEKQKLTSLPITVQHKNGGILHLVGAVQLLKYNNERYLLSVMTEKIKEEGLEKALKTQEIQVAELSARLKEMTTALRVFGDAWGQEKAAIQWRIKYHINVNVLPYVEKIRSTRNRGELMNIIRIIEENLQDLNPVFTNDGGIASDDFTPSENQIIQLVKHGKSSKEIAELLNLSTKAISFHRSNIRKKMKLVNKKVSLANILRNLDVVS
ncbi:MAG: LuxR C-terminal-related transcriptional regulator [Desulfobacteraceae bacterium]|nr:LuxR C-terminal-related transcriptional regulator [Desulfobacteraceae bacterium]